MINKFKFFAPFALLGMIVRAAEVGLESYYFSDFLEKNIITLLIALMAINTTTIAVILTKLKEIADATGGRFTETKDELKLSVKEQLAFIGISIVLLIIDNSRYMDAILPIFSHITPALLMSVLFAALDGLRDTGNSVFVILDWEEEQDA